MTDLIRLDLLKKKVDFLNANRIKWFEGIDEDKDMMRVYRKRLRDLRAAQKELTKLEVALYQERANMKYNEMLAQATDPEIQAFADDLHGLTCNLDHTDRCAYGYMTWDNPNMDMLNWYMTAQDLLGTTDQDPADIIQTLHNAEELKLDLARVREVNFER